MLEAKFRQIIRYFAGDLYASQIAQPAALNRNSVNRYLHVIRKRIAEFYETNRLFREK